MVKNQRSRHSLYGVCYNRRQPISRDDDSTKSGPPDEYTSGKTHALMHPQWREGWHILSRPDDTNGCPVLGDDTRRALQRRQSPRFNGEKRFVEDDSLHHHGTPQVRHARQDPNFDPAADGPSEHVHRHQQRSFVDLVSGLSKMAAAVLGNLRAKHIQRWVCGRIHRANIVYPWTRLPRLANSSHQARRRRAPRKHRSLSTRGYRRRVSRVATTIVSGDDDSITEENPATAQKRAKEEATDRLISSLFCDLLLVVAWYNIHIRNHNHHVIGLSMCFYWKGEKKKGESKRVLIRYQRTW